MWCQRELEVHRILVVVLSILLQHLVAILFLVTLRQVFLEELAVVLRPPLDRQLGDCRLELARFLDDADALDLALLLALHDASLEALVPHVHLLQLLPFQVVAQVVDDVPRVEVWHRSGPTCADAISTINQDHGDDRAIELRLDLSTVLVEVVQHLVIGFSENEASDRRQARVDVTRRGGILASLQAGSELALGHQQIQIVGANEVLGHAHDCLGQGRLAVVVGSMLRHIADQLSHLHVVFELSLEAPEHDLPLTRLKTVHHGWDCPRDVVLRELNQLLVHEVRVANLLLGVVDQVALLVGVDPFLAVVCTLLVECQVDGPVVLGAVVPVVDLVCLDGAEILLGLCRCACAQTLVVLDLVALSILRLLLPHLVLRHGVEADRLLAPGRLHNRREELLQEVGQLCKRRPPRVDQIDDQALDVGAIVILVGHDHDGAIPETLELLVVLLVQIEAHDLDDVLNLLVRHHLLQGRVTHVEQFTPQGEDAVLVSADNTEAGDGQRLGRVSLGQDEGACVRILAASVVGILQLRHASQPIDLAGFRRQILSEGNLRFRHCGHQDQVADATIRNFLQELFGQLAAGAKLGLFRHQSFLGLRVEGRVLDEAPDEDPQVSLDVVRLDVDPALHYFLALLLDLAQDRLHNLVRDVRHVRASADGADGVHEAHLVEASLGQADADLPTLPALLVDRGHPDPGEKIEVRVVLETFDVQLLSVQVNRAFLGCRPSNVVHTLGKQRNDVVVQGRHAELGKVWLECNPREGGILASDNLRRPLFRHVVLVGLGELLLPIACFHRELRGEHVAKLRAITVATTDNFAVGVVVVVAGKQVSENHLWDVDLVLLVNHNWQPSAVVHHRDGVVLGVNIDLQRVHALGVPHQVVSSIHNDLIKDLVEGRDITYLAEHHAALHGVKDPELLRLRLCGTNIGVGPEQDVLQLRLLLVDLLDALALSACGVRNRRHLV
mmetsp:Transcript_58836/g.168974  ORF Transcript_58836/g.168974 Transcript_58836/m.168974 type:complete len:955 (+) Transcript_58836:1131-3995(+)